METSLISVIEAIHLGKQVQSGNTVISILNDINLSVKQSETVSIVGHSGSGKSTLLTLLAGLDKPTQGRVILNGQDLTNLNEDERAKVRIQTVGFIFQAFHLMGSLTALENIMLPLELMNDFSAKEKATEWLKRVGLAERGHHYPRQLSGGEQQRVAIARSFVINPTILFADEITGNLDHKTGLHIADLLFDLNKDRGTTLVLVTHEETLANRCRKRYELNEGKLRLLT